MGKPNWKHPAVRGAQYRAKLLLGGRWRNATLIGGPLKQDGFAVCLGGPPQGWETSFGHLFEHGLMRFGQLIASLDDVKVLERIA